MHVGHTHSTKADVLGAIKFCLVSLPDSNVLGLAGIPGVIQFFVVLLLLFSYLILTCWVWLMCQVSFISLLLSFPTLTANRFGLADVPNAI